MLTISRTLSDGADRAKGCDLTHEHERDVACNCRDERIAPASKTHDHQREAGAPQQRDRRLARTVRHKGSSHFERRGGLREKSWRRPHAATLEQPGNKTGNATDDRRQKWSGTSPYDEAGCRQPPHDDESEV